MQWFRLSARHESEPSQTLQEREKPVRRPGSRSKPVEGFRQENPRAQYETLRRALAALQGASPLNG